MKHSLVAAGLLALGLTQMAADLLGLAPVKGIAAATLASPAPKVFSAVRGLETFSTRFFVAWPGTDGSHHFHEITPERYARLRGPYSRRSVYGAARGRNALLCCALLRFTWVVAGIEIFDAPGADAMKLNDGFAPGPDKVLHARGPVREGAGRHGLSGALVEFGAHAEIEHAADDGDVFNFRVRVRRDFVAVRQT